jgi:hypothetical protein
MRGQTRQRLFLDGSYDRDEVEACVYHPAHRWIVERLAAIRPDYMLGSDPDELVVFCRGCFVFRCGHSTEENPCMLPRHHRELHAYADGTVEDDSVWPGSDKPFPEWVPTPGDTDA